MKTLHRRSGEGNHVDFTSPIHLGEIAHCKINCIAFVLTTYAFYRSLISLRLYICLDCHLTRHSHPFGLEPKAQISAITYIIHFGVQKFHQVIKHLLKKVLTLLRRFHTIGIIIVTFLLRVATVCVVFI